LEKQKLRGAAFAEMLRMIREEEPPKPSTRLSASRDRLPSISARRKTEPAKLTKLVRGELDWIVMKALEKDRIRRYETANGLARDIQRYLADEPVEACPPSAAYKLRKFARKNRKALATAGAFVLLMLALLLLGLGNAWWWMQKQTAAESEARAALQEAQRWQQDARWSEALSAVRRAQAVLRGFGAGAGLRQQIDELGKDLEMAQRLEEARLQNTAVKEEHFDDEACAAAYAAAFAWYGLDVEQGDAGAAAEYIRSRSISAQLVAALDDWSCHLPWSGESRRWKHLLAVARAADSDAWRNRVRDAWERRDGKAMDDLLASAEVEKLLPTTLILLGISSDKHMNVSTERVAALLRRARQRHPANFWINHDLAILLWKAEPPQVEEAVRHFMIAVALRPQSPGAHLNLGVALHAKGRLDEAIAENQEALRLKKDYAGAYANLGNVLRDKGDVDGAIRAFQAALRCNPRLAQTYSVLGNVLREKGDVDGAIRAYQAALRISPKYAHAHNDLGIALRDKGDVDGAIREYRAALQINPKEAVAHYNLGIALRDKGDVEGAIAAYKKAIALEPKKAQFYSGLGVALCDDKHDYDGAIANFLAALQINPKLAAARNSLGIALKGKGDLDGAIREYQVALQGNPEDAYAHTNLGIALRAKGDVDGAIREYQAALRINPQFAAAHSGLGNALQDKGDVDGAIREYQTALRINPTYAEAYCNLGDALLHQGRFADALAATKRGHELGSKNPRWPYPSAQWVREAEQLVALERKLPMLLQGEAQPADIAEQLALAKCVHYKKKRYAAATRFYAQAFAAQPEWADKLGGAACAAALAGCGQGEDSASLDEQERARLRRQALAWLRADLALRTKQLASSRREDRAAAREALQLWLKARDFAGMRGDSLAKLPEVERQAWHQLWEEVADTLARAKGPAVAQKKSDGK
jgi:tetratricopeptide (TPR) repeat protein